MSTFFIPKSRKVKFQVTFFLHDLTNLPYVSGLYFVKWKLRSGGSYEGSSPKAVVKEHTVTWDIQFQLEPTIIIGKDGVLLPCELLLYIKQTVNAGKSSEDVGMVSINLAEFAASRSTSRRYLLQESRVNSTLRVTIDMKLLKGDPTYKVPETTKRDISTEALGGVFVDDGLGDHSIGYLGLDDAFKNGRPSQVHPILCSNADDPNVDLVNRLFASSAQNRSL